MARLVALVALATSSVLGAACGADRTGGPKGEPAAVVDAAPDRTVAAGRARFEASAPEAQRAGTIDFDASGPSATSADGGTGTAAGASGGDAGGHPELTDPRSVVDLVRGALAVESYGGAAVRGASTFRYEAVINVERAVLETPARRRPAMEAFARRLGADAFYVDLWIDGAGRLRRIQLPVEKGTERPAARSRALPALVTVDFFDFAGS